MNSLMRMAYGRSGNRLERVLVSGHHHESVVDPLWLKLLLVSVWLFIPIVVSRYGVPKSSRQTTVIDMSRLQVLPVPVPETPIMPKPQPVPPVEHHIEPQVRPEAPPAPVAARTLEKPSFAPPAPVPVITRQARTPELPVSQPRIVRERSRADYDPIAPAVRPIRRDAVAVVEPAARTTITRTRGASGVDVPVVRARAALYHPTPVSVEGTEGAGVSIRPAAHTGRSMTPSGTTEGLATRVAEVRHVAPATGSVDSGSAAAVGIRGVSLMSLEICPSPQDEEDAISKVLGVVGSRQSCTNSQGEFRFKGTKRISSFNLMIYPANGRRPSNRCEELENAYKCLKTR